MHVTGFYSVRQRSKTALLRCPPCRCWPPLCMHPACRHALPPFTLQVLIQTADNLHAWYFPVYWPPLNNNKRWLLPPATCSNRLHAPCRC